MRVEYRWILGNRITTCSVTSRLMRTYCRLGRMARPRANRAKTVVFLMHQEDYDVLKDVAIDTDLSVSDLCRQAVKDRWVRGASTSSSPKQPDPVGETAHA